MATTTRKPLSGKETLLPVTQSSVQSLSLAIPEVKCFVVRHHSAVLMYGALLESGLALLYAIGGMYYLMVSMVVPLVGCVAARKVDRRLARSYMLYIVLQMLLRVAVIVVTTSTNLQVAEVLCLFVDTLIIRAAWTYVRLLNHVSSEEREAILLWQSLKTRSPQEADIKTAFMS